jgi:hypothetical protein
VFQNAIDVENKFYWYFWTDRMASSDKTYRELIDQVTKAFKREPIDRKRKWGPDDY